MYNIFLTTIRFNSYLLSHSNRGIVLGRKRKFIPGVKKFASSREAAVEGTDGARIIRIQPGYASIVGV